MKKLLLASAAAAIISANVAPAAANLPFPSVPSILGFSSGIRHGVQIGMAEAQPGIEHQGYLRGRNDQFLETYGATMGVTPGPVIVPADTFGGWQEFILDATR